ncbi:MAG: helix-turn-helix domain-containing protein [Bacteroidales bacterium]|nr:helix-turn-helix domain-containing protein [Bacteroidales bacterium]
MKEMITNGMSERDIAQELGISKSKVHRLKQN